MSFDIFFGSVDLDFWENAADDRVRESVVRDFVMKSGYGPMSVPKINIMVDHKMRVVEFHGEVEDTTIIHPASIAHSIDLKSLDREDLLRLAGRIVNEIDRRDSE